VLRDRPYRRPIRLRDYDYTREGRYFVTIVAANRDEVFGTVIDGAMHLSDEGKCVADVWANLPRHYPHVSLDAFVVMPNHVHGIVVLGQARTPDAKRSPLSEVVRGFKTYTARRVNGIRGIAGSQVWQRNYYERIVRNEQEMQSVRRYIAENPLHWDDDPENPRRSR
jgi:REP element-mobilizing transposase RayT